MIPPHRRPSPPKRSCFTSNFCAFSASGWSCSPIVRPKVSLFSFTAPSRSFILLPRRPLLGKDCGAYLFMISGALLLGREESISTIFKKRIWRFLQVIFVFSLINYVWFYHNLPLTIPGHIAKFFTMLYSSQMATAYYFYTYI